MLNAYLFYLTLFKLSNRYVFDIYDQRTQIKKSIYFSPKLRNSF